MERRSSAHFTLYSELLADQNATLLDSLEEAHSHATKLLGDTIPAGEPVPVLVTASRRRFAPVLSPTTKGFRGVLIDGSPVIILVVNDSVRPYTRHEVMHDVAFKLWGVADQRVTWLSEAMATFADGNCQGVPNIVVARDLLQANPQLTIEELANNFWSIGVLNRHGAYVLGASFVEFVWQRGGRDSVRRLWSTGEWPQARDLGGSPLSQELSSAWRDYVKGVAGNRVGLDPQLLLRNGCG
jgi:hypothetical protein